MGGKAPFCCHCGAQASKHCGSCNNIQYCSLECQQADWQFHRHLCKPFASFKDKPSADVCRVIVLPEHEEKPHFAWLPMPIEIHVKFADFLAGKAEWSNFERGSGLDDPRLPLFAMANVTSILGSGPVQCYVKSMDVEDRATQPTGHSSYLLGQQDASNAAPNRCLAYLLGPDLGPLVAKDRRGPLVCVGAERLSARDLDTQVLTRLLEHLEKHVTGEKHSIFTKLHGVKVNATAPFLEEVSIPVRHPSLKVGKWSEASMVLRTPMRTWRYPVSKTAASTTTDPENASKTDANYLHFCLDPASPDFGTIPFEELVNPASMLIVREPGISLDIKHHLKLKGSFDKMIEIIGWTEGSPEQRLATLISTVDKVRVKANVLLRSNGLPTIDQAQATARRNAYL